MEYKVITINMFSLRNFNNISNIKIKQQQQQQQKIKN